jgi:hypothetical protein
MKKIAIKVGFCVAYDWELLRKSVPRVYEYTDTIVFSIDKHRKSWAGTPYDFDESAFQQFLLEVDTEKKIRVYEDDFSLESLSPIENDNRQRNLMAKEMGEGGWHIQIDSDEYFLDFKGFIEYLKNLNANPQPTQKPINICCGELSLIKRLEDGYIYTDNFLTNINAAPFATNKPDEYSSARRNGFFNHLSPFFVLHESWARNDDELWKKINSWGHRDDFNKESYFKLWQAIDKHNYQYIHNLHPLNPEAWSSLGYCEGESIDELANNLLSKHSFDIPKTKLFFKNSRNIARIKQLLSNLLK